MIKLSFSINFTMSYLKFTFFISLFFYCSVEGFQYWIIAQTWPAGFCNHNVCDATKPIPLKFTIHGLWPSNYNMSPPLPCSKSKLNVSLVSFLFFNNIILILYSEDDFFFLFILLD